MKLNFFAVKDSVVGSFMQPFLQRNSSEAVRSFSFDIKKNYKNIPNCKDLQLYALGTFDESTGEIESNVEFVANAIDFIDEKEGD